MSKRYGRNQRRAHRERIAELEAQVQRLLVTGPGDWRWDGSRETAFTLDECYVISSRDETFEGRDSSTERRANVSIIMHEGLDDALIRLGMINWRRLCWRIISAGHFVQDHRGVRVELDLEAVAPRDWTKADLPERLR